MANDLTGDFDVVAEFSVLAVDRALAAMHRAERLQHSMTIRVNDIPPHRFPFPPVIVGAVDGFGEAIVNQRQVRKNYTLPGTLAATSVVYAGLGVLVNSGINLNPQITPSNLQGVAQLQLDPPTIQVPDNSGANLSVRMAVRARYFADPNTSPAAQFLHGLLVITAPVNQVASQPGSVNVIDINISGPNTTVALDVVYSTPPLSAADMAGINQLIRNALRTGFQPSNATLPSTLSYLQFKTFSGNPGSVALLMNLGSAKGHPSTANNVFLSSGDDFAFAVGSDYLIQQIKQYMNFTIPSGSFYSYTFTINTPTIQLQAGKIVVSVSGHAHSEYLPDFSFTLSQAFTLNLVASTPGGPLDTAELAVSGDFGHDVSGLSFLFDWVANDFLGWALGPFRSQRDAIVAAHQQQVRSMFSVNKILGSFLNSLLNPPQTQPASTPPENVSVTLAYISLAIQPAGIVLHGSLSVSAWPNAVVQYQQIPSASKPNPIVVVTQPQGPDYSALKTWIPGGAIIEYDWSYRGQSQPFHTDQHKFVLLGSSGIEVNAPVEFSAAVVAGVLSGYEPLCLTVKGTRLSSSGPVVSQPVTATVCGYNTFPVINAGNLTLEKATPMIVLTQPSADGTLDIIGHTPALTHIDKSGKYTPNVLAHFADDASSLNLDFLIKAVKESGRQDAGTAVLALLTQEQLSKTRHTPGVIYGDRHGGAWERAFGIKSAKHPLTLIATPDGRVVWKQEGPIDAAALGAALKQNLAKGGYANRGLSALSVRSGHIAPNFVFEIAEGAALTLGKLKGRTALLGFWLSTLKPSYEAIRDLQESLGKASAAGRGPVLLAINDGETVEVAKKAAADHKLTAILVTDPQRQISSAYGVSVWPTIVSIDPSGAVSAIRYGRTLRNPTVPSAGTSGTATRKQ